MPKAFLGIKLTQAPYTGRNYSGISTVATLTLKRGLLCFWNETVEQQRFL